MSGIEWTDETWNPLVGCSKASAGCRNCYAIGTAASVLRRLDGRAKNAGGLATVEAYREALDLSGAKPRWAGRAVPMPHQLDKPLRWRKPRKVFVNSMSDLFHPSVSDDYIAAVFGVMAACPQHTFQVLTKHPDRAAGWFAWLLSGKQLQYCWPDTTLSDAHWSYRVQHATALAIRGAKGLPRNGYPVKLDWRRWPLPNVWLGTSVEDQASADERIPHLLRCPAAVRWVSCEPMLEDVDFHAPRCDECNAAAEYGPDGDTYCTVCGEHADHPLHGWGLDWIVVGGESGPGARQFNVEWARSVIRQCYRAEVPVFVKQLGACYVDADNRVGGYSAKPPHEYGPLTRRLRDRKGGDVNEWPADLRVREWPEVTP